MDEGDMAMALADALNEPECWKAVGLDIGEIHFTNEYGEHFLLTVECVEGFDYGSDDEEGEQVA